MKLSRPTRIALLASSLVPWLAVADPGHDHGPAAAAAASLPRFATSSELFELVGVVDGRQVTVYLDRFEDNAPVRGATLALEIGGAPLALKEAADGEFRGTLATAPPAGITAVTATVTAGADNDLLAADLDVRAEDHAEAVAPPRWRRVSAWTAGVLVAVSMAFVAGRAVRRKERGDA